MAPFSKKHAKWLLSELPSRLETVLENRRYWDPTFLRVYLDYCDSVLYDDPRRGLELAEIAPVLALRIPKKEVKAWQYARDAEKQRHRELVVRSFAVLGGAYRAVARFDESEAAYRSAIRYARSGSIGPLVRADLNKRLAKLLSAQGRFDEALKLVDFAIETYRDCDRLRYADALNTKGYVLFEATRPAEAVPYFGRALALAKGRQGVAKLADRTVFCATHNLAAAVLEGCSAQDLSEVLALVIEAKKYQGKCRNSVAQQKLAWVEARIHAKFGCGRAAERRLMSAQKKLIELGAAFEAALVGLELAVLYLQWAEWHKVESVARETYKEFQALSSHTEAVAALQLWVDGARARSLTREILRETQATIEKLVVKARQSRS